MSPAHFVSTIGHRVDSRIDQSVAYSPKDTPLLLITDSAGQRSIAMVDQITQDALHAGWGVQNFRRTPFTGDIAPEQAVVCQHRSEHGTALMNALTAYADMVQEVAQRDADRGERLNTIIVVEDIDQLSRADRRIVLRSLCTMLHHGQELGVGVVMTSTIPQITLVAPSGVAYIDVRFDHNSFHSAYSPSDHHRTLLHDVKYRKDIAYARFTNTQRSVILETSSAPQRIVTTG